MRHHLTLSLQVCSVCLRNGRVSSRTRLLHFDATPVCAGRPRPWSSREGGWTKPGAARVLRASVQSTSAALSCKYHQQLVARKLVVLNESLAYMRRAGRVAAAMVVVVGVVVGGGVASSAFLPTALIQV